MFKSLIVHVAGRQYSNQNSDSEQFNDKKKLLLKTEIFPFSRLSRPPLREYKQSMAMQASPLPNPLKRKLMLKNFRIEWDHWKFERILKI